MNCEIVARSGTQWYKNVLPNPTLRIDARGVEAAFRGVPITGAKAVKSVVEKFREKYGAKDVKKYYSQFDVAVWLKLIRRGGNALCRWVIAQRTGCIGIGVLAAHTCCPSWPCS